MRNSTLMVHLQANRPNLEVLQMAAGLAERHRCAVIGIAARQLLHEQMAFAEGYVPAASFEHDRTAIAKEMTLAEAEFRLALQAGVATLEWRARTGDARLSDILAEEVRSADLLTTAAASADAVEGSRVPNLGDLVLRAGRPVLLVPSRAASGAAAQSTLQRVVVCWNDTREARRAILDALPLIRSATYVAVVGIATTDRLAATRSQLADVTAWLGRHGVAAEPVAAPTNGDDYATLDVMAQDQGADLVVAGAYGHSRLRQRVFGGVTRDFLLRSDRCVLLSH